MLEINFFGMSGSRTPEERIKKINNFKPNLRQDDDYLTYGYDYYDNPDYGVGYGGYHYDGRYAPSAAKMIKFYNLDSDDRVLEIGCAKGFILGEFLSHGLNIAGIDVSNYAINNSLPITRRFLAQGSCVKLPFPDNTFELVYAKEMLPHLTLIELAIGIDEIIRVSRANNIFFEIQVIENLTNRNLMKAWDPTHKIIKTADWWRKFFKSKAINCQVNFKEIF